MNTKIVNAVIVARHYTAKMVNGDMSGLERTNQIRTALMGAGFTWEQVHEMINVFDPANPNEVKIPAIA